ncbi:MAG: hypothetical protein Q8S13_09195 [Dehalococcoidia bacterium]|nr:hypothetical protein [Dehalococcoidia bacterium]
MRHDRRIGKRNKRLRASDVMARIYAEHPDPPGLPRRRLDLRDRRAVRRAIAKRLRERSGAKARHKTFVRAAERD